ncbi:MAG: hypothetical protein ABFD50_11065 [Smithella sp.]
MIGHAGSFDGPIQAERGTMACGAGGPFCSRPKLTTGAGNNFNAGFILGQMLGCSDKECLLLGNANSGFYVRKTRNVSYEELIYFEEWKENILEQN